MGDASEPKRRLALVVHGIGEQLPGETIDALVGNLTGDQPVRIESERRILREVDRSHDISNGPARNVRQFPCETRTVRQDHAETVFAEVYWGDLSRGASGRIWLLVALFQLVTGLGHIVRENAADIHPDGNWKRTWANAFVVLLQGPIMVLNIVMALGVFLLSALTWALSDFGNLGPAIPTLTILIIAAILLILPRVLSDPKQSCLFRIFWRWMTRIGLALPVFAVASHLILPQLSQATLQKLFLFVRLQPWDCRAVAGDGALDCLAHWYTDVLIVVIGAIWAVAIGMVAILGVVQFVKDIRAGQNWERTLYPATCAAMLVLWMFMAVVAWVSGAQAVVTAGQKFDGGMDFSVLNANLVDGISLSFWIWCAFLVLVGVLVRFWFIRQAWIRKNTVATAANSDIPRTIVYRGVRIGLTIGMLFLMTGVVLLMVQNYAVFYNGSILEWRIWLFLKEAFEYSLLASAAVALLYGVFHEHLSVGIGIAKDIVVYFVRHPDDGVDTDNPYPIQRRIQDRFDSVFKVMMASVDPEEVVVISHSQGTLIAFQSLRNNALAHQMRNIPYVAPKLITMGSPITHIYGLYFKRTFGIQAHDRNGIGDWRNIYRIDDFVGTYVRDANTPGWPSNHPVAAKGHTGYWTDDAVRPLIEDWVLPPPSSVGVGAGARGTERDIDPAATA